MRGSTSAVERQEQQSEARILWWVAASLIETRSITLSAHKRGMVRTECTILFISTCIQGVLKHVCVKLCMPQLASTW